MDDTSIFLYDENEEIDEDHINENNIVHKRTDIQDCDNIQQGIYDISKLINKEIYRENILLSCSGSASNTFDFLSNDMNGITYKKNVIGFRLNECIFKTDVASKTYLDIVVEEIPYGACKYNSKGLNIIHRLPWPSGGVSQHYKANFIDYNHQYLFTPINLSQLTINLYDEEENLITPTYSTLLSLDFELTILNK